MARGSIQRRERDGVVVYDAVTDVGINPATGKRRQARRTFGLRRDAERYLAGVRAKAKAGTTMADLFAEWLATYPILRGLRPTTIESYERQIARLLLPRIGALRVQEVTLPVVKELYAAMLRDGLSRSAVTNAHQRLMAALDDAVDADLIAVNPARVLRQKPSAPRAEKLVWTLAQARTFLAHQMACPPLYGPLWPLGLCTGMRCGELLGLRWRDIDWAAGMIRPVQQVVLTRAGVSVGPLKTTAARRAVAVPPPVLALLRNHARVTGGDAHVFLSRSGELIRPNNARGAFSSACIRAGVPRIGIHGMRHTYTSLAARGGFTTQKALSTHLGHTSTVLTMDVYQHVTSADHHALAAGMGTLLLADGPQSRDISVILEQPK